MPRARCRGCPRRPATAGVVDGVVGITGQVHEALETHVRAVVVAMAVDVGDVQLLHQFAHARAGEDHVRLDQLDDLEELELVAVVDVVGAVLAAGDDLLEILLVAELRRHRHHAHAEVVLDRLGPVPQPRATGPDRHLGALQPLLVPLQLGAPLGVFVGDQFLALLLDAEEGAHLADAFGHVVEAPAVDIQPRDAVALLQLVGDVAGRAGAVHHVELGAVHAAQIVVVGVAGEVRDHLDAQPVPGTCCSSWVSPWML